MRFVVFRWTCVSLVMAAVMILGGNGFAQVEKRIYLADPGLAPREHSVDMQHLKLEVDFEPAKGLVKGTVTHTFTPLRQTIDTLFLDAPGIRISKVDLNGISTRFKTNSKGLTVFFRQPLQHGSEYKLEIEYEANPRKGIYFIGWNDPNNLSRKQIWTQGQGIDNRHWIPCYDSPNDKLTTELIVTFDSQYEVLSNGLMQGAPQKKGNNRIWHYKMNKPHTTYLVMLGIGEYEIETRKSASGIPMKLYYYPDWKDRVEPTYRYSVEMFDWFEQEIGFPYPWESYAQIPVQDFMYGAMENTTATLFGDFFMVDDRSYQDRNYVAVNAHELAHQWFGDAVTARTGSHHWLQESFATFYNTLWEREAFGQDHYDWKRRDATNSAVRASKSDFRGIGHSQAGSVRHYPKGAHVLHMLRNVTGRESYNRAIRHYLEKHAYQNVDSEDLLVAFHEELGLSLDWFWEEWVYRGGEPEYAVEYRETTRDGKPYAQFLVNQVHAQNEVVGLFDMPMVFQLQYSDGTSTNKEVRIHKAAQEVLIPIADGKQVAFPLFDPNSEVMKQVTFPKSNNQLKAQAQKAEHMLDRYDAVKGMASWPMAKKAKLFNEAMSSETFFAVKGEIIKQAAADRGEEAKKLIRKGIQDKDPKARGAALDAFSILPEDLIADFEPLLQDQSYTNQEKAIRLLCQSNPQKALDYLRETDGATGTRGRNVRIAWLEQVMIARSNAPEVQELIAYTSNSYEFLTRVSAAQALSRLNVFTPDLLENLVDAVCSNNGRLARPCRVVLNGYFEQNRLKRQIANYVAQGDWTKIEKRRLQKYQL